MHLSDNTDVSPAWRANDADILIDSALVYAAEGEAAMAGRATAAAVGFLWGDTLIPCGGFPLLGGRVRRYTPRALTAVPLDGHLEVVAAPGEEITLGGIAVEAGPEPLVAEVQDSAVLEEGGPGHRDVAATVWVMGGAFGRPRARALSFLYLLACAIDPNRPPPLRAGHIATVLRSATVAALWGPNIQTLRSALARFSSAPGPGLPALADAALQVLRAAPRIRVPPGIVPPGGILLLVASVIQLAPGAAPPELVGAWSRRNSVPEGDSALVLAALRGEGPVIRRPLP